MAQKTTWREARVTLQAGTPFLFSMPDTRPNILILENKTNGVVYVSRRTVSQTEYEMQVSAGARDMFAKPDPLEAVYLLADSAGDVVVYTAAAEFSPQMVPLTQKSAALGTVDVSDRAARAIGKAGLQVNGADVGAANPVPVTPGTGARFPTDSGASASGGTNAANTQVTVTINGVANQRVRIRSIAFGFSGAAPAAPVQATVADGVTTLYYAVSGSGVVHTFGRGWQAAVGANVTITLPAGGAGAIGNVTVEYEIY